MGPKQEGTVRGQNVVRDRLSSRTGWTEGHGRRVKRAKQGEGRGPAWVGGRAERGEVGLVSFGRGGQGSAGRVG